MWWSKGDTLSAEVGPKLRRLCNISTMRGVGAAELRIHNRLSQVVPVLLCPIENQTAVSKEAFVVVAKDISDNGVALILQQPLRTPEAIVGFWIGPIQADEPWFFRAVAQRDQPIGGGFRVLGLKLVEFLNNGARPFYSDLISLAHQLVPPS
jgi:hypothetical protein